MLFDKSINPNNSDPNINKPLTSQEAMMVYEKLRKGFSPEDVYMQQTIHIRPSVGLKLKMIQQVKDEAKRIEMVLYAIVMDDNKISKADALKKISSNLLNVDVVIDDVILLSDNDPGKVKTWQNFKDSIVIKVQEITL